MKKTSLFILLLITLTSCSQNISTPEWNIKVDENSASVTSWDASTQVSVDGNVKVWTQQWSVQLWAEWIQTESAQWNINVWEDGINGNIDGSGKLWATASWVQVWGMNISGGSMMQNDDSSDMNSTMDDVDNSMDSLDSMMSDAASQSSSEWTQNQSQE